MLSFTSDHWLSFPDANSSSFGTGLKLLSLFRVCLTKGVEVASRPESLDLWKCCLEFGSKFGEKFKGLGLYNPEAATKEVEGCWPWGPALGLWRSSFLRDRTILVKVSSSGLSMEKLFVWVKGRTWSSKDACKNWFKDKQNKKGHFKLHAKIKMKILN